MAWRKKGPARSGRPQYFGLSSSSPRQSLFSRQGSNCGQGLQLLVRVPRQQQQQQQQPLPPPPAAATETASPSVLQHTCAQGCGRPSRSPCAPYSTSTVAACCSLPLNQPLAASPYHLDRTGSPYLSLQGTAPYVRWDRSRAVLSTVRRALGTVGGSTAANLVARFQSRRVGFVGVGKGTNHSRGWFRNLSIEFQIPHASRQGLFRPA